jgi:hypothetical protein
MNILNELLILSEAKEKNLIGLTINGKKITEKTSSEHWAGDFDCYNNKLTSLKGAPASVGGHFRCSFNNLTSLEGAPSSVDGYFDCSNNKLTSLEGAPASVGGNFECSTNKLTSLEDAPSSVDGYFSCSFNNLASFEGIEKILKKMDGNFYAEGNPLKSHVIGLLLMPGCKEVDIDNKQVEEILNRHLKSPFGKRRFFDCQSELLDANLDDWAKL